MGDDYRWRFRKSKAKEEVEESFGVRGEGGDLIYVHDTD